MRRVAVENAQMGMILSRAVYDGAGTLILDAGTVLDSAHLPVLPRLEVREVIVQKTENQNLTIARILDY